MHPSTRHEADQPSSLGVWSERVPFYSSVQAIYRYKLISQQGRADGITKQAQGKGARNITCAVRTSYLPLRRKLFSV